MVKFEGGMAGVPVCGGLGVSYSHFPKTFLESLQRHPQLLLLQAFPPLFIIFLFLYQLCKMWVVVVVFFYFLGKRKVNKDHGQWLLVTLCAWLFLF